jgi:hypothetical protein
MLSADVEVVIGQTPAPDSAQASSTKAVPVDKRHPRHAVEVANRRSPVTVRP